MVREYIGARYVPKFMGTYDATQIYEALCVVDNGLGTSYISKVPTPAGTPLTDTDYWAIYGASSGAIINLQNQIDDMNDSSVSGSLQNQITEMKDGNISGSLQNQIDANTAALAQDIPFSKMGFNINKYHNVICIADSWGGTDGWCDKLNSMGFSDGTFQEVAHGGTGFQTGNPTFEQSINTLTPLVNADEIDCIVIIGGTNDQTSLTTLPAAIGSCVSAAKTRFPNATVYVGFNLHYIVGFGQIDATETNGSIEVIKNGGVPLTGLSFNQRFNKWDWTSDNWHLSDYTFFAEMIYSGVYCGTIDIPRIHVEEDLGISTTNIRSVKANYHSGYCYLTISLNSGITYATLANIISAGEIPLLTLHGKSNRVLKASTGGDTLDLIIEEGVVDTFIGGTIGNYPIVFNVISHHGVICN